jgi:hypothetical protein
MCVHFYACMYVFHFANSYMYVCEKIAGTGNICIYAYLYACMHVFCMRVCMCFVCVYACVLYACMHVFCMRVCMCFVARISPTQGSLYVCTCIHIHQGALDLSKTANSYIYACIHTYIHTYIHKYTKLRVDYVHANELTFQDGKLIHNHIYIHACIHTHIYTAGCGLRTRKRADFPRRETHT